MYHDENTERKNIDALEAVATTLEMDAKMWWADNPELMSNPFFRGYLAGICMAGDKIYRRGDSLRGVTQELLDEIESRLPCNDAPSMDAGSIPDDEMRGIDHLLQELAFGVISCEDGSERYTFSAKEAGRIIFSLYHEEEERLMRKE